MSIKAFDPQRHLELFDEETRTLEERYDILPKYGDADALADHVDSSIPSYSYQILRLFEYMRNDAEEYVNEAIEEGELRDHTLDTLLSYGLYHALYNRAARQRARERDMQGDTV